MLVCQLYIQINKLISNKLIITVCYWTTARNNAALSPSLHDSCNYHPLVDTAICHSEGHLDHKTCDSFIEYFMARGGGESMPHGPENTVSLKLFSVFHYLQRVSNMILQYICLAEYKHIPKLPLSLTYL